MEVFDTLEPWEITSEIVDAVWAKWEKFKETAEQHDFIAIFKCDVVLIPMRQNLSQNWDVDHAHTFLKCMNSVFNIFGIK